MNYPILLKILAMLILFLGISMSIPLGVAFYFHENDEFTFALSMLITLVCGGILMYAFRNAGGRFRRREAFAIVSLGWILCAVFGSLPFVIDGTFPSLIDAYFETMSGFTTTGASVMTDIESKPNAILFWRSMTHWFGGIGIIVLFVAVLPFLGVGGRELFFSEVPGPIAEGLRPRITQTARTLVSIYCGFCVVEAILLKLGGMTWLDAWCHTFGTMATGGFSTKNASVGHYDSAYIDGVITMFMFFAGANFSLYYMLIKRQTRAVVRDAELRYYISIILICIALLTVNLWWSGHYDSVLSSFRFASFQVLSINTTTGYCTADFDTWPSFSKILLVLLMFVGGSAGSTGGGMKVIRIVVVWKYAISEVFRSFRPNRVIVLKMGRRILEDRVLAAIIGFFVLYVTIFGLGTLYMSVYEGMDVVSAPASVVATLSNIGPGLAKVGATQNYFWISQSGKVVLIFFMLLGRLELYAVLVLLLPSFWKKV